MRLMGFLAGQLSYNEFVQWPSTNVNAKALLSKLVLF